MWCARISTQNALAGAQKINPFNRPATTMDPLTVALQQARATAFQNLTQQVVSQFANAVEDKDDEDWRKRGKSVLQQQLHWAQFVMKNKH
jgi:hypothetical protein